MFSTKTTNIRHIKAENFVDFILKSKVYISDIYNKNTKENHIYGHILLNKI